MTLKSNSQSMATVDTNGGAATVKARQHIEHLRKHKFSIGDSKQNPLTQDLHEAVTSLSAELYTKDVHFLMELIQNAEDNTYLKGVEPALEFVLTTMDITNTGAPATLLVFNNELGFTEKNIDSICSIGRSTKKGLKNNGFIGEKGIGFKSVFLVSPQPHIFSNGYKVRFNELPVDGCGVGYIVPEWVYDNPTIADIQGVYGTEKMLPATTIVLPLKTHQVEAVKKRLSEVHPEVLLFLNKIKRLSIRESKGDSSALDSVSSVAIGSETSLVSLKSETADSRIVQLSVQEGKELNESTCRYFIWRQSFHVKPECLVDGRRDVKEWNISLAFPFGERLKRGTSSVGVFAFLPTTMVTNFPFIIQADFILASSRESILLDNKWNLGILECVSPCFLNAITSSLKSTETKSFFSVTRMLDFMPVRESASEEFNRLRQSIKTMVQKECIIPCESFSVKCGTFRKPNEVIRIFSDFRKILLRLKKLGINLNGISCLEKFVLHSSIDLKQYDEVLNFVGVLPVHKRYDWYGQCIEACDLIKLVPVDVYMDFLGFFSDIWSGLPHKYSKYIPILKYITGANEVAICSISEMKKARYKIHLVLDFEKHSWLNKCNLEMCCPNETFFCPDEIVRALLKHKRRHNLEHWLKSNAGLVFTTISEYCSSLGSSVVNKNNPKLVVSLAHLIYHASLKQYIQTYDIPRILNSLPIVDGSGKVHTWRAKTLVPASSSKWAHLFGSNPFNDVVDKYVDLTDLYGEAAKFGSDSTNGKDLLDFLVKHTGAIDLPNIPPLTKELEIANSELTKEKAFFLLDWIRCLRSRGNAMPSKFLESISNGSWLKAYSGFHAPNVCCLCDDDEEIQHLIGNFCEQFPVVDQEFYGKTIQSYVGELKFVGVTIGIDQMHVPVIDHLEKCVSFTMKKEFAIFLLSFIKILKDKYKLREELVHAAKEGNWLKTNRGYSSPVGSIILRFDADAIIDITHVHVIDLEYYDGKIECFTDELELLGVVVNLQGSLKIIADNFKFPRNLSILKRSIMLLVLRCIKHLGPEAVVLAEKVKNQPWIKTSYGYRCPTESVLLDKRRVNLSKTVPLPLIDEAEYGNELKQYKTELKAIGVVVDIDGITRMLSDQLINLLSSTGLTSAYVFCILECMKCMGKQMPSQMTELKRCLLEVKWLKTLHGYKSASDSILFDSKWGTVVQFLDLPFIDEVFYGTGINSYKDQLKMLGVVIDFSEGAHYVAKCLILPKEPPFMTADTALSLIQSVSSLRKGPPEPILYEELISKLKVSKWVKTHLGYRSPQDTVLYDPEWSSDLEKYDAPFIDESFYTNFESLEKADFKAIGVKVDIEDVCYQMFQILSLHTQTCVIMRIYKFLKMFHWSPGSQDEPSSQIWIPDHHGIGGKWVDSRVCVLQDKGGLFRLRLHSLDKYYERELLIFLKSAFGVGEGPSVEDYIWLWNNWVKSMHKVTLWECTSFWQHLTENWNTINGEILKNEISMLPATSGEGIDLVNKSNIFIPDDFQLKKLFSSATLEPLFVWYPRDDSSLISRTKLSEIYNTLGVKKISESVEVKPNCALPVDCKLEVMGTECRNKLIAKPLMKIVLAFFASQVMTMSVEERHKTAKTVLDVSVVVTGNPVEVNYMLKTDTLEQLVCVTLRRMVVWEKSSGRLIVKEANENEQRNNIEFVTDFARAISEGILQGRMELVGNLCKIIQMGFVFGFREDAVNFLLMTENLELSDVDQVFLNSAFPPVSNSTSPVQLKRGNVDLDSLPTPEISTQKRKKR